MLKKLLVTSLLGLSCTFAAYSGTMGDATIKPAPLFYVGGYGGYGSVLGGYKNDGNVTLGRFALGVHAKQYRKWMLGGEVGVQSGNTMRLSASPAVVDPVTGLPPQAVLKPLLDLLFTVKAQALANKPIYYILKGGIAYRQFQLEDRTVSDGDGLSNVTGEFQAGLGLNITEHVFLNAFYQGIYSNRNAGVTLDSARNTPIAHIPTQQAGFLGVEYSFF